MAPTFGPCGFPTNPANAVPALRKGTHTSPNAKDSGILSLQPATMRCLPIGKANQTGHRSSNDSARASDTRWTNQRPAGPGTNRLDRPVYVSNSWTALPYQGYGSQIQEVHRRNPVCRPRDAVHSLSPSSVTPSWRNTQGEE